MRRWAAVLLVVVVAGCGSANDSVAPVDTPDSPPGATDPPGTGPRATDPSDEETAMTGEVPDEIMAAIRADAAKREGVAADGFTVVRAEQVQWRDGSLGCPEPGIFYTQALVDGYHVELAAPAGTVLDYRVDNRGQFKLCGNQFGTRPPVTP